MFHTYFFIRHLSSALNSRLRGWEFVECFSQNKDELVLALAREKEEFYIKCNFSPQVSLIEFPQEFKRAKRNSINLFPDILGSPVQAVHQIPYDRSFYFELENGLWLLFKLYGRRSNIIQVAQGEVAEVFRSALAKDLELTIDQLGRHINIEAPEADDIRQLSMLIGKELATQYPEDHQIVAVVRSLLNARTFYIHQAENGKPVLDLLQPSETFESTDPIATCQELYYRFIRDYLFLERKKSITGQLQRQVKKLEKVIDSYQLHLEKLKTRRSCEELANIVMANLHLYKPGMEAMELEDFYRNDVVTIQLKPGMKPQHYAENLYRKAKNEKIEHQKTRESLEVKEQELLSVYEEMEGLDKVSSFRELNQYIKKHNLGKQESKSDVILPYREVIFLGYQIWIGKNARSNDELTLKHARKDDLWLHARDVSGSHVVIRNGEKRKIPDPVLEGAAALAAYHSKRKSDTLCPVIYTPKKYVRKRKGDPPGAVVVDREQVIMVKPAATI